MRTIFNFALFIRLTCLFLFRDIDNYDLRSYLQVGELTLKGINIYPDIANLHHPYLPFFLYVEALAVYFGQSKIIVITIIKFINIIFDLGILYLVYLLSKKNLKTTFLYAINPVTILVTTLHGQFDVIPAFFVLLSIYLLNKKQELLSILGLSFAVLTKTWPLLFIIPIARRIKNKKLLILIIFFLAIFVFIYTYLFKSSLVNIGKTLIYYQGLWGIWGTSELLGRLGKLGLFWQKLTTFIFLISFFSYSYINNKKSLTNEILNLLFFFFIFTTNFSIQYFAWIVPFLILVKPRNYFYLILLISVYLFSFYFFWLFCFNCGSTPNWLATTQNIIGFILWISFIKVGCISSFFSRLHALFLHFCRL